MRIGCRRSDGGIVDVQVHELRTCRECSEKVLAQSDSTTSPLWPHENVGLDFESVGSQPANTLQIGLEREDGGEDYASPANVIDPIADNFRSLDVNHPRSRVPRLILQKIGKYSGHTLKLIVNKVL